jgi:hypothetical protein
LGQLAHVDCCLQGICHEAVTFQAFDIARGALAHLHSFFVASSPEEVAGLAITEAAILRSQIQCILDQRESGGTGLPGQVEGPAVVEVDGELTRDQAARDSVSRIARLINTTVKRLTAVGSSMFFGIQVFLSTMLHLDRLLTRFPGHQEAGHQEAGNQQLEWFVETAWNCGLEASKVRLLHRQGFAATTAEDRVMVQDRMFSDAVILLTAAADLGKTSSSPSAHQLRQIKVGCKAMSSIRNHG